MYYSNELTLDELDFTEVLEASRIEAALDRLYADVLPQAPILRPLNMPVVEGIDDLRDGLFR